MTWWVYKNGGYVKQPARLVRKQEILDEPDNRRRTTVLLVNKRKLTPRHVRKQEILDGPELSIIPSKAWRDARYEHIVYLRIVEQLSAVEIAKNVGVTKSYVHQRLKITTRIFRHGLRRARFTITPQQQQKEYEL